MNFIGDIIRAGSDAVTSTWCTATGGHKWIRIPGTRKMVCDYCGKVVG